MARRQQDLGGQIPRGNLFWPESRAPKGDLRAPRREQRDSVGETPLVTAATKDCCRVLCARPCRSSGTVAVRGIDARNSHVRSHHAI